MEWFLKLQGYCVVALKGVFEGGREGGRYVALVRGSVPGQGLLSQPLGECVLMYDLCSCIRVL